MRIFIENQKISKNFGAEAPFLRPKKFSTDTALDYDYILHATKFMIKNNYHPDLVVLLRPTTPNRETDVVDKGIRFFIKVLKNN